jgi:hypothetical protein
MSDKTTSQGDAELRALLATLLERWQEQHTYYTKKANGLATDRRAHYAVIRATRLSGCMRDLRTVLGHGHLPYDLMTPAELAERGMTRQDIEPTEIAEAEANR